ncbi:hypothetical protein [Acaryochloris sp. IP29b_bin.148]|uniref:hypothetical protein n=1 Tax=Acaryochloris sp. IP29b_bin.148 TaxID=2969218 RepID=UPI00262E9738|nr:hypothetical protein [Acaryochloris sp. IP29b_bin.148]
MSIFTVSNTNDNGSGSLRQAIEEANATPGADQIEFDPLLKGQEITLTSGELDISDDLDISGGKNITINGNHSARIFTIDDFDPTTQIEVSIDRLKLTGGSSSEGGGAINNAENLKISRSKIIDNENTSLEPTDGGGAIRNADTGRLEIDQSLIAKNQSSAFGGGITNFGELEVSDSIIFGNEVTGGGGGGIDNRGSLAHISGTIIAKNVNTVNPAGGFGNGTPDSTTIVEDSLITGNQATDGAGFFVNAGKVELIDSLVVKNQAQNNGGGAALAEGAILEIDSSLIAFNRAELNGGGLANLGGNVTLVSSKVFGNEALTGDGGGIFNDGGSLDLNSSFIVANTPNNGIG